MNGPARTWNAVVAGEDTPCWPGIRRHEHLKACAAQATARCCRHDFFANLGGASLERQALRLPCRFSVSQTRFVRAPGVRQIRQFCADCDSVGHAATAVRIGGSRSLSRLRPVTDSGHKLPPGGGAGRQAAGFPVLAGYRAAPAT